MNRNKKGYRVSVFLILCVTWLISACAQRKSLDAYVQKMKQDDPVYYEKIEKDRLQRRAERTEVMGVSMSCFNHGDYRASGFSVEEVAHGQISRGMIGGAFNCGGVLALGYPVPLTWRPGLKVKVRWNTYAPKSTEPTRHEKETTIPPYSEAGSLYVHFFPGDQVRVVVSAWYDVGHPLHPIAEDMLTPPPEIE